MVVIGDIIDIVCLSVTFSVFVFLPFLDVFRTEQYSAWLVRILWRLFSRKEEMTLLS